MATDEKSSGATVPAVKGTNDALSGAFGFLGGTDPQFNQHAGVYGESDQLGIIGHASNGGTGVFGNNKGLGFGVRGETVDGNAGVQGQCFGNGDGIVGISAEGNGVVGRCTAQVTSRAGVLGVSIIGPGVEGFSTKGNAIEGHMNRGDVNVSGFLAGTDPIFKQHAGVYGESNQQGVMGLSNSDTGTGVYGGSAIGFGAGNPDSHGIGVRGETMSGVGVQGRAFGQGLAGKFIGDVEVTGDIRLVNAGDCAEDFDIAGIEKIEPGTVMVLDKEGALQPSQQAYDKKVAGVVSGAGDLKPGIILDKQQTQGNRMPIALMGKVYCKVDANYGAIEVGDLLTTSPTPGHAMKADDPLKAFGAVIGKALRPFTEGQGMVPILIALQ